MMTIVSVPAIGIYGKWRKDDMTKKEVIIMGATGMLGSMILDIFSRDEKVKLIATYRDGKLLRSLKRQYPKVQFCKLDIEKASLKDIIKIIKGADWVINAIGITKPYIHDNNAEEIKRAIHVNAIFPHLLNQATQKTNSKIIQIATDCVFSGQKSHYIETNIHDATDVYGKTKSLGEVYADNFYNLRCSIIGRELNGKNFLLDWLLDQPKGAKVNGFTNHKWNGITTLHFAKICLGIVKNTAKMSHVQHIVPGNALSKADLLKLIAEVYNRKDIKLREVKAPTAVDRTLSTNNKKLNRQLWEYAGYVSPPTISKMVKEMANI
jgi:dTDP-4-dehydrorhamnose reductase